MKYFFANWKENTNYSEACALALEVKSEVSKLNFSDRTAVILPPSIYIIPLFQTLSGSGIVLGVQDVSKFEGGAYTGEISAKMVKPYAKYVLLGHSERRANFGETSLDVNQKIGICFKEGLLPLVCVSSKAQLAELSLAGNDHEIFIVYEPVEYIGGEETQTTGEIAEFFKIMKGKTNIRFIYGGSVNEKNATELLKETFIDGLLVGHSSLDAKKFSQIISSHII